MSDADRTPRPLLGSDGLDRKPQHMTDTAWYYEEKDGITVYFERSTGGQVARVIIPFRKLARSLRRIAKARGVRL